MGKERGKERKRNHTTKQASQRQKYKMCVCVFLDSFFCGTHSLYIIFPLYIKPDFGEHIFVFLMCSV